MGRWGTAFVERRFQSEAHPDVVAAIDRLLEKCDQSFPNLTDATDSFVTRLAMLAPESAGVLEWLEELNAEELYLASACALGIKQALALFDERYLKPARGQLVRMRLKTVEIDEVIQALAAHLLVHAPGVAPKIATYEGIGPLGNWVRSAAVRLAISRARRTHPQATEQLEVFAELQVATGDPELDLIRERFRREFRSIFPRALASLAPEDRTLLKLHYIDQVPLEKVGLLFSLHKSNVSRRLSRIRADLLAFTRALMQQELRIDETQLDSLMRLADRDLNVSLETFLGST